MGNIRLYGSTSGYTELAPPAVAPDGVLSLPTSTGTLATQASVGLVKIVDQSFTAASSVSVNNCFTSAYENYRLIIASQKVTGSPVAFNLRFRSAGSDATAANYDYAGNYSDTSGAVGINAYGVNQTAGALQGVGTGLALLAADIRNPFSATNTVMNFHYCYENANGSANITHKVASSYDGFTIYPTSGEITGTIRVYGYRN